MSRNIMFFIISKLLRSARKRARVAGVFRLLCDLPGSDLSETSPRTEQKTSTRCTTGGRLEVLSWAPAAAEVPAGRASAAEGGHLEVLKWAPQHDCDWDEHCFTIVSCPR